MKTKINPVKQLASQIKNRTFLFHRVNKNLIAGFLLVFGVVFGSAFSTSAAAPEVVEQEIVEFANKERQDEGLSGLEESELLNEAAKLKAQDMLGNDYFAHTSPTGVDPWDWFEKVDYEYKYAGENLAMDFSSASSAHRAWMKSETHKENILSSKYKEIGVAVMSGIVDKKETVIAVQLFGIKMSEGEEAVDVNDLEGMEEKDSNMEIGEVSVSPWQASGQDEMLAYAEINGEPEKVEAIIGDEYYQLEKLREGVYMNLIYFNSLDLIDKKIVIKATDEKSRSISKEVPNFFLKEYMTSKENREQQKQDVVLAGTREDDNGVFGGAFTGQNAVMMVIMGIFVLTIFNVWILEKEEDRLLAFRVMEGLKT